MNSWKGKIETFLKNHPENQGVALFLPEYRPDIARAIAFEFNYVFADFRQEVMAAKGLQAHETTINELTSYLIRKVQAHPVLAFNIEALLATKSDYDRGAWLESFLQQDWKHRILLPLVIFHGEVARYPGATIDLTDQQFADQKLINRLAM
ncbi:MAG: hypothetical protein ACWA44_07585 [Thiotrichales bacterium]